MFIKICGLTNLEDAQKAVELGADAIGFIFARSPRRAEPDKVKSIIRELKGDVLKIGVFVNEDAEKIKSIVKDCRLDAIQLHGDESPEFCSGFTGLKLIKAVRVKNIESLKIISDFKNIFACLLDTYSSDIYGGTGKTFNWELAVKAKEYKKPIILSGGLNIDNIEEAIRIIRPYGVDISSSIESRPGKKDITRMSRVIGLIKVLD